MAHRTFGNAEPEQRSTVTFTLQGTTMATADQPAEVWKEDFTCVPVAPAGVLDDIAASMVTDAKGNIILNAPSLLAFLRGVLVDDDVPRMEALARDKRRLLPLEDLGNVVMWLTKELTGHPSTPASS